MGEYREYELSDDQLNRLMDASKPTPAMYLSGGQSIAGTPQENVEQEWRRVAGELGCKWQTIGPVAGKSNRFITAQPA